MAAVRSVAPVSCLSSSARSLIVSSRIENGIPLYIPEIRFVHTVPYIHVQLQYDDEIDRGSLSVAVDPGRHQCRAFEAFIRHRPTFCAGDPLRKRDLFRGGAAA